MQQQIFSDSEIEDYLDGVFTGDITVIRHYLENTEEGRQRLANIQALYTALSGEEEPKLSMALDAAVMDALARRSEKKSFAWNGISWVGGAAALGILLFYCLRFFEGLLLNADTLGTSGFIFITIIIIVALTAFQWADVKRMRERYKLTSHISNA